MDPVTLSIAAAGAVAGVLRSRSKGYRRKRDRKADKVLLASWEQIADLEYLARKAADRDGRDMDHVLNQYGAMVHVRGRRRRKELTRKQAAAVTRDIGRGERVTLDKERRGYDRDYDPLIPRDGEEPF